MGILRHTHSNVSDKSSESKASSRTSKIGSILSSGQAATTQQNTSSQQSPPQSNRRVTMNRIRQKIDTVRPLHHNHNAEASADKNAAPTKRKNCPQCSHLVVHKEIVTLEEAKEFYHKHADLMDQVMELHSDIPYLSNTQQSTQAVHQFLAYSERYGSYLRTYEEALLVTSDKDTSERRICKREKAIPLTSNLALKDCLLTVVQQSGNNKKKPSGHVSGSGVLVGQLGDSQAFGARVHISHTQTGTTENHTWTLAGRLVSQWTIALLHNPKTSFSLQDANVELQLDSQTKEWNLSVSDTVSLGPKFPSNTLSLACSNWSANNACIQITVDRMGDAATGLDLVERTVDFASPRLRDMHQLRDLKKVLGLPLAAATLFVHPTTGDVVVEMDLRHGTQRFRTYFLNLDGNEWALVLGSDTTKCIASTDANVTMTWGPLAGESLVLQKGMNFPNY